MNENQIEKSGQSPARRVRTIAGSAAVAVLITAVGQGVWGTLAFVNMKTTPAFPWAVVAMAPLLWLMWQYLNGRGWPQRTAETRRALLRARPVSGSQLAWALVAGVFSIAAASGLWIVLFDLVPMRANLLPNLSKIPLSTLLPILLMGCLAAPFSEEAAFRGYFQGRLEREIGGPVAILLSSILFALVHLTQGLFWPKLLVYFLAGLAFGLIARLTRSILPGIAVHALADLTFFTLVWPYDGARRQVWETGTGAWFWLHVAQVVVGGLLAVLAFRRLATAPAPTMFSGPARSRAMA
ncbi:MAG TPA: CPBP family intramembrane glutamic endopeptidase [Thermoanaerobaculia bacterium]|nr:CPBP family intramembrane glutamic endopeptidase [Thermoanaerobaculia bacterium]